MRCSERMSMDLQSSAPRRNVDSDGGSPFLDSSVVMLNMHCAIAEHIVRESHSSTNGKLD